MADEDAFFAAPPAEETDAPIVLGPPSGDDDPFAAMERLAPRHGPYAHEETWHDDNGHSHVRAATVGPALALPVVDGAIPLGTWQQIVFMDFDTRPRRRTVHLSVIGV